MSNKKEKRKVSGAENKWPETSANSPKIRIWGKFGINFKSKPEHEYQEGVYRLDVPTSYGNMADVRFAYAKGEGDVFLYDLPIQDDALKFMNQSRDLIAMLGGLPPEYAVLDELICLELNSAARRVIEFCKFFLGRYEIADEATSTIETFFWTQNDDPEFYHASPGKISAKLRFNYQQPLDYAVRIQLQEGINKRIEPFAAMRHIYRALNEQDPKFKWIDATIAAELTIKEALIRKEPKLEALLEHVPSPPLTKLYGEVMEFYFGKRSEFVRTIQKGVEMRNKLVHQPRTNDVSSFDAEDYAGQILIAINELYGLLYPDWTVAKNVSDVRYFG